MGQFFIPFGRDLSPFHQGERYFHGQCNWGPSAKHLRWSGRRGYQAPNRKTPPKSDGVRQRCGPTLRSLSWI